MVLLAGGRGTDREVMLWARRFQRQLSRALHRCPAQAERSVSPGRLHGKGAVAEQKSTRLNTICSGPVLPLQAAAFDESLDRESLLLHLESPTLQLVVEVTGGRGWEAPAHCRCGCEASLRCRPATSLKDVPPAAGPTCASPAG